MIIQVSQISKSYGTDVILDSVSFHIEKNEKAAVIGNNGAGKSTLFKIIAGEEIPDSGTVSLSSDIRLGYLAQYQEFESGNTVYDEILSMKKDVIDLEKKLRSLEKDMKYAEGEALDGLLKLYSDANHEFERLNGYAFRSEVTGVLKGLGFTEEDFGKELNTLSGGQKTRVSLAKLLVSKPEIILLDEPTNHLDLDSVAWLENYINSYPGAVLIIAHDRYFLNRTVTKIIEIERSKARVYSGNYESYAEKKKELRKAEINAFMKNQAYIAHQEEVIAKLKSFNREKSIKRAESRMKVLAKTERLSAPMGDEKSMHMQFTNDTVSGNDVLTVKDLSKAYGDNTLFTDFSALITRGEKVAIIGGNGTGKTTLLKILRGLVPADSGSYKYGAKVSAGYYDQEQQVLDPENTVFEEVSDNYPDMTGTEIRNSLAAFCFTGDDVFKLIKDLSGGEKGRLSLALLMLSQDNFLMLDEPTNHLDITSKEVLEDAVRDFKGTVLYVSHDRYFINRTATRILELKNNRFYSYDGNYDYYMAKREIVSGNAPETGKETAKAEVPKGRLEWSKMKELEAAKRKKASRLAKCEAEINRIETRLAEIDKEINNPEIASNSFELTKLSEEQEELNNTLLERMEEWDAIESEEISQ